MYFDHFIIKYGGVCSLFTGKCSLRVHCPVVVHLHPVFKPQGICMNAQPLHGAFTAFPKQNDKCPTNVQGDGHAWI